ncbi:hypothetical protein BKA70DRAFT_1416629 [Coprinopsis sp. MPI-PUGE-AT-0042]|nr:hypothetical protein BKA70DRAFT_1416629 [Coprinopsis sp. MPI-PUGE-AT-0042]
MNSGTQQNDSGSLVEGHQHTQDPSATRATEGRTSPLLPDIPSGELSLDLDLKAIVDSGSVEQEDSARFAKLQNRASNVLRLSEENDKLKEELAAMTARLEAAERRKTELKGRSQQQHMMEPPSS